jgi:hemerythrin
VHFDAEETLLETHGYPGLKGHQTEHWEFIKKVRNFEQAQDLGLKGVRDNIIRFLTQWLLKHIRVTDQHYAEFLKDKLA